MQAAGLQGASKTRKVGSSQQIENCCRTVKVSELIYMDRKSFAKTFKRSSNSELDSPVSKVRRRVETETACSFVKRSRHMRPSKPEL